MRGNLVKQSGVVLRKIPYSDADEIVTVLLQQDGLRRFFVAGSRKSKKRYQGLIDHFAHLKFEYKESHKGLWRVMGVDVCAPLSRTVWSDLEAFSFGNFLAELICELTPEAVADEQLYSLWIELQEQLGQDRLSLFYAIQFLMALFEQSGYALEFRRCVVCGDQFNSDDLAQFMYQKGGLACVHCCQGAGNDEDLYSVEWYQKTIDERESKTDERFLKYFLRQLIFYAESLMQKRSETGAFFQSIVL